MENRNRLTKDQEARLARHNNLEQVNALVDRVLYRITLGGLMFLVVGLPAIIFWLF